MSQSLKIRDEVSFDHQSKNNLRLKSQSSQFHTLYTSSTQDDKHVMMLYFASQERKQDGKSSSPEKISIYPKQPRNHFPLNFSSSLVVVQKSAGFSL
jgi:hypothetical protein